MFRFGFLLVLFLFSPELCRAKPTKKITAVSSHWINFTNKDGSGGYWEVLEKSLKGKYTIEKMIVPWKRAVRMFQNQEAQILLGAYSDLPGAVYPKHHIDVDSVDVIFKKAHFQNYSKLKDMRHKSVGWRRGYSRDFKPHFTFPVVIREFDNVESGLRQLAAERIDFILDYRTDIIPVAKKLGLNMNDYQLSVAFSGNKVYACFGGGEAKNIRDTFDLGFTQLLKSGELKTIHKKWNWTSYFHSTSMDKENE